MGGIIRNRKVLYLYKSNNGGRNLILVFSAMLSAMERSLWNYQKLKTLSPHMVRDLRERVNDTRSMLCAEVKSHCPMQGLCG